MAELENMLVTVGASAVTYSDRSRERNGDYLILARRYHDTGELEFTADASAEWRAVILADASADRCEAEGCERYKPEYASGPDTLAPWACAPCARVNQYRMLRMPLPFRSTPPR